jgi:hypothetical protein
MAHGWLPRSGEAPAMPSIKIQESRGGAKSLGAMSALAFDQWIKEWIKKTGMDVTADFMRAFCRTSKHSSERLAPT